MFPKPVHKKQGKQRHTKIPCKGYCQYCGRVGYVEQHHIIFKGMGGTDREEAHSEDNQIFLCRHCHDCAHNKVKGQFITREQLREALTKDREREQMFNNMINTGIDKK